MVELLELFSVKYFFYMSHDSREILPAWANVLNMCCTNLCKSQYCWMTFRATFREKTFAWMLIFFISALGLGEEDNFNMTDFYKSACRILLIKVFVHSYSLWHEALVSRMRSEGCVSSWLLIPSLTWKFIQELCTLEMLSTAFILMFVQNNQLFISI